MLFKWDKFLLKNYIKIRQWIIVLSIIIFILESIFRNHYVFIGNLFLALLYIIIDKGYESAISRKNERLKNKWYKKCIGKMSEFEKLLFKIDKYYEEDIQKIVENIWTRILLCETAEEFHHIYNDILFYINYFTYILNDVKRENSIAKYLKILELPLNTKDWNKIKNQYRKLVKLYHPDINPNGTEKIKEINRAYDELAKIFS